MSERLFSPTAHDWSIPPDTDHTPAGRMSLLDLADFSITLSVVGELATVPPPDFEGGAR